jgi:hypothetical protein
MPLTKATQNVIAPNICTIDTTQTITGTKNFTEKVGIGTTTPTEKLDVVGNIKSSGTVYSLGAAFVNPTGDAAIQVSSNTNAYIDLSLPTIDDNDLRVGTNGTGGYISTSGNGNFNFALGTGKVGIGQANPTDKLEVAGNIRATGNATFNNVSVGAGRLSAAANTAVGFNALENCINVSNTAVGNEALANSTSGIGNTSVGAGSLQTTVIGDFNTSIGVNSLTLHPSSIGNTSVGAGSLQNITTGDNNTAIGRTAGSTATEGSNNVFIGRDCIGSSPTVSNEVNISNGTVTARFAGAASAWSFVSDERDKKNIEDLTIGLDFINQLKARKFEWDIRDCDVDKGREASGFIAQEVIQVIQANNAEYTGLVDTNNPDQYTFAVSNLIPILVKAVQELSAKVAMLESK